MITRQKENLCYKICVASPAAPLFLLGNLFSDTGATVTSFPEDIGKVTCPGSAIFYTDQDSDLCQHWTPTGVSHTFSNSTPWAKWFITIGQRSCERISNMCVSGCAFELNKKKYSDSTWFHWWNNILHSTDHIYLHLSYHFDFYSVLRGRNH